MRERAGTTVLVLVMLLGGPSLKAAPPPGYPSASVCGECHEETYDSWSRTIHALAVLDPIFVEAMERAELRGDPGARKICLSCHSPTTVLSGDYDLALPVSREGVTCSFCHSVTAVDHTVRRNRFTNDPSRLHIVPERIEDHHFENHGTTMSPELCAGCHEWTNSLGLKVLGTYSEWKESFYAGESVTCQQCHMPKSLGGEVVREGAKSLRSTNLHFQMGGHSQDQLVSAARMEAAPKVEEKQIVVEVALTNFKAGHKLPTGIPTRRMKLLVDLYDREGQLLETHTREYGRVIADAEGKILDDVTEQFLHGARELSDTRIAPKETREERFLFERPTGVDFLLVEVSLEYDILTPYLTPPVLSFDVIRKRIPLILSAAGEAKEGPPAIYLIIILALFLIVSAGMILFLQRRSGKRRIAERKE